MPASSGIASRAATIDRHHFHRGQLLAGLHQADLGRQRRAGAPGEQQRRHDRAELAHQRQRDQQPQGLGRAVALQGVVALQSQHETDEQPGHRDDRQGPVADDVQLLEDQPRATQGRRDRGAQAGEEEGGMTQPRQDGQSALPQAGQQSRQQTAHERMPSASAIGGAG
jgi:hypothetical protein